MTDCFYSWTELLFLFPVIEQGKAAHLQTKGLGRHSDTNILGSKVVAEMTPLPQQLKEHTIIY